MVAGVGGFFGIWGGFGDGGCLYSGVRAQDLLIVVYGCRALGGRLRSFGWKVLRHVWLSIRSALGMFGCVDVASVLRWGRR